MASRDGLGPSRRRRLRRHGVLGTPERAIWLTKQGDYIKTWRRRWFVLKQDKVFCFKESTVTRASRPRGIISVANCLTVKGADDVLLRQNLGDTLFLNSQPVIFWGNFLVRRLH
ncbi:pleckstrin homology domain-containing protein 1 [Phtheirospermum japonicum]|uniref:Pleckstrin homology domain-containing protein 1 n=1 Tax=Phtheirospermum japonicum TaxID=374723 RepID=A0A830D4U9_9LAMI|nr:pleckstrin homology domain-containing protein 1 [Phtheirospermum japonicum]GFQ03495.1 pleckstrin homology domain-containing protein 1 [Phtheirospermum japonicum]